MSEAVLSANLTVFNRGSSLGGLRAMHAPRCAKGKLVNIPAHTYRYYFGDIWRRNDDNGRGGKSYLFLLTAIRRLERL